MTEHGSTQIEFPSDLDIVMRRTFQAPVDLVFDVMTKPEHLRKTMAPFDETVTECSIDLREGGEWRGVFVTPDGVECSFRGTYLEVEPPTRTVATWHFEGWPGVEAVETTELREEDGASAMTYRMSFRDQAGRDHMRRFDGHEASFDKVEELLRSLTESRSSALPTPG